MYVRFIECKIELVWKKFVTTATVKWRRNVTAYIVTRVTRGSEKPAETN
jgi:hypothetical protein